MEPNAKGCWAIFRNKKGKSQHLQKQNLQKRLYQLRSGSEEAGFNPRLYTILRQNLLFSVAVHFNARHSLW